MSRTLTKEQTSKLFAFLKKEEIYDYDLQIEIIDHLASSIEEQWEKDPTLGFGWALKNACNKFGKNGFRKMERKITRQLKHKFRRVLWKYFLEYFKLPKILITLVLSLFILTLLQLTDRNTWIIALYFVPLSIVSLYYHFKIFPEKIDIQPVEEKTFMVLNYLQEFGKKAGSLVMLPPYILAFSEPYRINYANHLSQEIIISTFMALLSVFLYGYFFYLPQKIREYFLNNYSEFTQ